MNVIFEPKKFKKEQIVVNSVDIRNFYVDDTAFNTTLGSVFHAPVL